jgi:hypothetical protein
MGYFRRPDDFKPFFGNFLKNVLAQSQISYKTPLTNVLIFELAKCHLTGTELPVTYLPDAKGDNNTPHAQPYILSVDFCFNLPYT